MIHTFVIHQYHCESPPYLNEKIQTTQRKVEKEKRNKRKYIPCDIQHIMCHLYGLMPLFFFFNASFVAGSRGRSRVGYCKASGNNYFTDQDGNFSICDISSEGIHTHTHKYNNIKRVDINCNISVVIIHTSWLNSPIKSRYSDLFLKSCKK